MTWCFYSDTFWDQTLLACHIGAVFRVVFQDGLKVVLPGKDKVLALRGIFAIDSNDRFISTGDFGSAEGSNPGFGTQPSYPIDSDIFVSYYSKMQDNPWWKATFLHIHAVKEVKIYMGLCEAGDARCAD